MSKEQKMTEAILTEALSKIKMNKLIFKVASRGCQNHVAVDSGTPRCIRQDNDSRPGNTQFCEDNWCPLLEDVS